MPPRVTAKSRTLGDPLYPPNPAPAPTLAQPETGTGRTAYFVPTFVRVPGSDRLPSDASGRRPFSSRRKSIGEVRAGKRGIAFLVGGLVLIVVALVVALSLFVDTSPPLNHPGDAPRSPDNANDPGNFPDGAVDRQSIQNQPGTPDTEILIAWIDGSPPTVTNRLRLDLQVRIASPHPIDRVRSGEKTVPALVGITEFVGAVPLIIDPFNIDGEYTLQVDAGPLSASVRFEIAYDDQPPRVDILEPIGLTDVWRTDRREVRLRLVARDDFGIADVTIQGRQEPVAIPTPPPTRVELPVLTYPLVDEEEVVVTLLDIAGNQRSYRWRLVRDTAGPTVRVAGHPLGEVAWDAQADTPTYTLVFSDPAGIEGAAIDRLPIFLEFPATGTERVSYRWSPRLRPGENRFTLDVYDRFGNQTTLELVLHRPLPARELAIPQLRQLTLNGESVPLTTAGRLPRTVPYRAPGTQCRVALHLAVDTPEGLQVEINGLAARLESVTLGMVEASATIRVLDTETPIAFRAGFAGGDAWNARITLQRPVAPRALFSYLRAGSWELRTTFPAVNRPADEVPVAQRLRLVEPTADRTGFLALTREDPPTLLRLSSQGAIAWQRSLPIWLVGHVLFIRAHGTGFGLFTDKNRLYLFDQAGAFLGESPSLPAVTRDVRFDPDGEGLTIMHGDGRLSRLPLHGGTSAREVPLARPVRALFSSCGDASLQAATDGESLVVLSPWSEPVSVALPAAPVGWCGPATSEMPGFVFLADGQLLGVSTVHEPPTVSVQPLTAGDGLTRIDGGRMLVSGLQGTVHEWVLIAAGGTAVIERLADAPPGRVMGCEDGTVGVLVDGYLALYRGEER